MKRRSLLSFFMVLIAGFLFMVSAVACSEQNNSPNPTTDPANPSNPDPEPGTPLPPDAPETPESERAIVFVTQVPIKPDFATIGSTFANHQTSMSSVGRGGDLMIRYADGSLKNLTKEAGFGSEGFQGANAIAVRDPVVHWDAKKILFSMVVGAPTKQYEQIEAYWQLYEVTGLGKDETPVVTRLANQPENYNNLSPIYSSDDQIIFTSDRPVTGERHLYPQLDEYESTPTNTGLWKLEPLSGKLTLVNHAPSGNFTPLLDSFGRVLFTQWDHLQRDQQAGENTFNYSSESPDATEEQNFETFPEPLFDVEGDGFTRHRFNHFLPWMVNQDGTEVETINHVGRHELHSYFNRSRDDDPALSEMIAEATGRTNTNNILNMFYLAEDPTRAGYYFAVDAPEFGTHGAGQIIGLYAPPGQNPDDMQVDFITHEVTRNAGNQPEHSGFYRSPLVLADERILAVHTTTTRAETREGDTSYDFRLKWLEQNGTYWQAAEPLTSGIRKSLSYWVDGQERNFDGFLWEMHPVELRTQKRPELTSSSLPGVEQSVFDEVGVDLAEFQAYLKKNQLSLIVSRDITVRDDADVQQPFNLQVRLPDDSVGAMSTIGEGKVYDVSFMQIFQANQVRGMRYREGRRSIAQPIDDELNSSPAGQAGSVPIFKDGSVAAVVPAERALVWQLTNNDTEGIVKERNWLTFQAGEVRVCASCHGLNHDSQTGGDEPINAPEALKALLETWKAKQ